MAYAAVDSGALRKRDPIVDALSPSRLPWEGGGTAAPPPVTAPGPGGGGSSPAPSPSNPFETNPGYLAALAAEQTGSQQADAALRAAQEAAIVGYGDPSIAAALGIDVADNTAAAARANTLAGNSTTARLGRQRDQNQASLENNLAAHGIVRSGELGYQTGQIGQNYGHALYDAQQLMTQNLNAAQQQDLAAKQGLRNNTVQALSGAYDLFVSNPAFYGAASQGPAPPGPPAAGGTQVSPLQNALLASPASVAKVAATVGVRKPASRLAPTVGVGRYRP